MARTLTAARAMVRPEDEAAYRDLLGERLAAARERGAHFWVFRNRGVPGAFLEFTEGQDGESAARSDKEIAVELRMRAVAMYGPDAEDVWEEIKGIACPDVPSK